MRRSLAVVVFFAALLTVAGPASAAVAPAAAGAAYTTADGDVFVVGPDGQTRRIYEGDGELNVIRQSEDLRYVAIRLGAFSGSVAVVDTVSDEVHEWDCVCGEIGLSATHVVAFDPRQRRYRFPLDGGEARVKRTRLPESEVGLDFPATPLSATARKTVVAIGDPRGTSAYGGPERLYVVRNDGTVRRLRLTDANRYISTSDRHPDRPVVAYDEQWHADACRTTGRVTTTNIRTGETRTYAPPGRGAWRVVEIGYSRAGVLHASMLRTRLSDGECEDVTGPALFRRHAGQWVRIRNGVSRLAFGPDGAFAFTRPSDNDPSRGRLSVVDAQGERTVIARSVTDVVWGR